MAIIDLIIRIKNGYMARREQISSPHSKFRVSVLAKLQKLGYILSYEVTGELRKNITIVLKYENGEPVVTDVKVHSKPGRRIYTQYKEVKSVRGGLGYSLLSTSQGILTGPEAKKKQVGGELLFYIW
ncbi:MAG: 30S ribosomal protein S8 [bacterium]|nr:30S ribosomal protein S8 [bacterium]